MSTHGCFATPLSPSSFFPVVATSWWILGARCHHRRILLHGGHRRPGVVRRSQAGGLSSSIVDFCASLLKASLSNFMSVLRYCCFRWLVYDQALVFEPSRPLACIMMLVWLNYVVELCCDIFPWVLDLDRTHLRVWLVYDWTEGVTTMKLKSIWNELWKGSK